MADKEMESDDIRDSVLEKDMASNARKLDKEPRQRKKKIINALRTQMEFYFSSANINKDRFMFSLVNRESFAELSLFMTKFNAIKNLTDDVKLLIKAVKSSSLLELSEDQTGVRRVVPIEKKDDENESTIYVENLPSNADHNLIREIFSQYGKIDYISLPRFKESGRPKGFAFIEFDTPETAEKALKAHGNSEVNPADLMSIVTYGNEDSITDNLDVIKKVEVESMDESHSSKRKRDETDDDDDDNENDDKSQEKKKKLCAEEKTNSNPITPSDSTSTPPKKKKKRKRNKKHEKDQEIDNIQLRVMSKREWKRLRNKYLNMQKKNIKALKWQMREQYQNYSHYSKNENHPPEIQSSKKVNNANKKPEFVKDTVIKITFDTSPQDPKKLRESIRDVGGNAVAYVDASNTEKDVFVRFHTQDGAKSYLEVGSWSKMSLLDGDDEKKYWDKLISSWEERRSKRKPILATDSSDNCIPVSRGKDKVIQKAFKKSMCNRPNTHIVFED